MKVNIPYTFYHFSLEYPYNEKYFRKRRRDNQKTHFTFNNLGYKYTLTVCNTYGFATATMVARTPLSVTFYVPRLSSLIILFLCQ